VVYAPNAARWLLAHGRVPIRTERAHVQAIDGGVVHLEGGARRGAAAVVLAGGVQSTKLCPDLPLQPKKGHLAITDRYPGTVQHQLVELAYVKSAHLASGASVAFNVQPRPSGQLLIGSSRQFDSADPAVEPAMLARMLACALAYMPALDGLQITRSWAGFRAAAPDGLPLIGAHPSRDKLWLAVGHEGLGVTTAPATARLLAAQITGAACALDARPYHASRFLVAA
jgi:glycine/D-amino acid oxidase-like deaminating enzyme